VKRPARGVARRRLQLTAFATAAITVLALSGCSSSPPKPAAAATAKPSTSASSGFTLPVEHPTVWVCKPGLVNNPCSGGLSATVVQPDGTSSVEPFTPAKDPKIDCFYVYPTVSQAKSVASPLAPEPASIATTRAQVARFQSVCRLFVPAYRQITLFGLDQALNGKSIAPAAIAQATADVVSAWHDYLDHYNDGRGVVLLGHSQGAGQIISLMEAEVDRSPAERAKLVSAVALGGNLLVPQGNDVGGDLQHIPACRTDTQHDCVVAYSSFSQPPQAGSLFGRASRAVRLGGGSSQLDMQVLCVNPAALMGGSAALHPYLPTAALGTNLAAQDRGGLLKYATGFVAYPGQVTGTCKNTGGASWLQIDEPHPGVAGKRVSLAQALGPTWGLHLLDFNIDQGDLVDLVTAEAASWS
jgi:Protein of unknown function (DUF3089)